MFDTQYTSLNTLRMFYCTNVTNLIIGDKNEDENLYFSDDDFLNWDEIAEDENNV